MYSVTAPCKILRRNIVTCPQKHTNAHTHTHAHLAEMTIYAVLALSLASCCYASALFPFGALLVRIANTNLKRYDYDMYKRHECI